MRSASIQMSPELFLQSRLRIALVFAERVPGAIFECSKSPVLDPRHEALGKHLELKALLSLRRVGPYTLCTLALSDGPLSTREPSRRPILRRGVNQVLDHFLPVSLDRLEEENASVRPIVFGEGRVPARSRLIRLAHLQFPTRRLDTTIRRRR